MRWHLPVGLVLLLATPDAELSECLVRTASAQQASLQQVAEPTARPDADRGAIGPDQPLPESRPPVSRRNPSLPEQLAADPFQYRTPEGTGAGTVAFTPSPTLELPPGIKVAGILVMDSGAAVAALQLPGEEDLYHVREEDNLQIRNLPRDARAARGQDAAASPSPVLYLKISKITPEHVVVYPEHSPTNIHVFR